MATRVSRVRFEGPCTGCEYGADCVPYKELSQHLYSHAIFRNEPTRGPVDIALDLVVANFVASIRALNGAGRLSRAALGTALSALVDYCITGIYTRGLIDECGQFAQRGVRCGRQHTVFPYTWMCPMCVAEGRPLAECYLPGARRESRNGTVRDYPQVEWLAKPGGRAIGDQGIQVVKALLRATLAASGTGAQLRDGGGARGEFDLTVATREVIAFIEVKAKPLIAYPLVAEFVEPAVHGEQQHEWIDLQPSVQIRLFLFLGAVRDRLALALPNAETAGVWPLTDMAKLAADPDVVSKVVDNWQQHAHAYAEWTNEADHLRWHRFGCGNFHDTEADGIRVEKRVANTKELPGLDRTDDIKKGAAQVLKYSRLKFDCRKRALRAVLLGNTHALTHHDDYVAPLINLKVLDSRGDPDRTEWIFDAMIGLTQDHFNAQDLRAIFAFDKLLENPGRGTV